MMIQKLALGILFVLWLLSILVPPWEAARLVARGTQWATEPAGYGWIFEPPRRTSAYQSIHIDYGRLALEWLFLGSIAGAIVYFQRRKP